jgi:phage terminase large subunit-like protein
MTTIRSTYPDWLFDGSESPDPFRYGERAVRFLRALKHPKSTLLKRAFQLDPWQERIVRAIYGPRNPDGSRIVSTVVILVPRGNRKTSLSAALALLHTIGPELVPGGEAIFAASDRKQAGIAFKEARGIVQADSRVLSKLKVYDAFNSAKRIAYPREGSELEVVSSDAPGQEGRTPAFVLADEIHVWRGSDLWKVLTNGLDKTDNSLLVVATTAGRGQDGIAHEVIERARKIARGEVIDPTWLPVLFEADADCDYTNEDVWRRVNPGSAHGYPSLKGFRQHVARAKDSPTERDSLKQYKLNIWLDHSTSPFVDMATYDRGSAPIDLEAFRGRRCWVAVDMSKTTDLSAVIADFPDDDDGHTVLPQFFCPADDIRKRGDLDGVDYVRWSKEGFLIATPGNVIDNKAVANYIRDLCERFDVQEIIFDVAYAQAVMSPLSDEGYPVTTMRQGWVTQSPALNELERAIVGGKFRHGGHPILRWNFSNVAIHTDSAGNRVMHKGKSTDRIDGAVASWMAVSRAASGDAGRSVYDDPNFNVSDWL